MGTCIPIIFLCFFWGCKCLQYPTPELILTVSPADIDNFWPPNGPKLAQLPLSQAYVEPNRRPISLQEARISGWCQWPFWMASLEALGRVG